MRAIFAAALAVALAGAPVTGQAKHKATRVQPERARRTTSTAAARLRLWENGAILLASRLERRQESTPEQMRSDVNALGRNIADARSALEQLRREAHPADKPRLDSVRTHLDEARKRYRDLYRAQPDPGAIATHAAEVRQHLVAAQNAMSTRGTPVRTTRRRRTVRARRSHR